MNTAMKIVCTYLDSKGIRYTPNEEKSTIKTGFKAENKQGIELLLIFDDSNDSMAIRSFEYVSFPANKIEKMYEVCSKMNKQYRWIKFYVDENDNTITLGDDAVIQLDTAGDEAWELIVRMVSIGDEAYPEFMKALWS